MRCFFGCFSAKKKIHFQTPPDPPLTATKDAISRISRNQLSDLFLSQELEEISCEEKITQPESVIDTQCCQDKKMNKVVDSNKLPDQTCSPSPVARQSVEGLDGLEESPTSCISDPPSASRNSVSTNAKTLSSGLKPVQHNKAGNKVNNKTKLTAYGRIGKSPRDRPALHNITAQWNEEADPLKWWDGNGIPNSTNKYREDQIVSWDVTPFEERLEKALSEANSIAQRTHISGAHGTSEEEIDTAAPQLHSIPQQKYVVTF